MADLKLGNILPVGANNIVVEGKYVKGTYVVFADIAARNAIKTADDETIIAGSLCYVQSESKFYKYTGTAWEEVQITVNPDNISIYTDTNGKLAVKVYATGGLEADSTNGLKIKLDDNGRLQTTSDGLGIKTGADGVATLDSTGKVPLSQIPDVILGNMALGGTVTYDSTGDTLTATLSANAKTVLAQKTGKTVGATVLILNQEADTSSGTTLTGLGWKNSEGFYFIAQNAFHVVVGTVTYYFEIGDWLISIGTGWRKIDNTDAVTGVKGSAESAFRTGNVEITAENIGVEAGAEVNVIETIKVGTTEKTPVDKIVTLDPYESGAQVNVTQGVQINGNDLTIDTNKKQNISLESELTFDTTSKKIKITRPATANGQVLTAKSDGTVAWEDASTGDHLFKDASQGAFATYAEFSTAAASGTFYLANGTQKASSAITKGDYAIVSSDENHSSMQTRYGYTVVAGSYASGNWAYEYSLGSAYTGTNGVQVSGTEISIKLDTTASSSGALATSTNGLKVNDGWSGDTVLILDGGNAALSRS